MVFQQLPCEKIGIAGGKNMFNWIETILTFLVITIGTLIHGIAGFGLAQVSMGLMPIFRSPASASVIFSVIAVIANFKVWWSVREHFQLKDWVIPVIGLLVGMPTGIYFFNQLQPDQLRLAIGLTLIVAICLIVLLKQFSFIKNKIAHSGYKPGWVIGVIAGCLAGFLGGTVAIPGPPMIIYGTLLTSTDFWSRHKMKAVFTSFFGTLMFYRLISLIITGDVTVSLMMETLIVLPGLFLGVWLGIKIYNRISEKIFSQIVLALLTVNALVLLFNS